jgi:hypothetical protein
MVYSKSAEEENRFSHKTKSINSNYTIKIEQSSNKRKHTGDVCEDEKHKRHKTTDDISNETKEMSTQIKDMSAERQSPTHRANFKSKRCIFYI